MDAPDHPVFDADQHYYEAEDAFTRHLDPALGPRCVQWAEINGRRYHVLGGRVSRAVTNATFDPISKPGCLSDYFRGNPNKVNPLELIRDHEPIRAEYRGPAARADALDAQGISGCFLFPTLGMIYEEPLKDDPEAVCLTFRAFNRWLAEDWGFTDPRIVVAPYLTLANPDWAVEELGWALAEGARLVVMRAAAPTTRVGRLNPFAPDFDAFWGRVNEAGITVVIHAGDGGTSSDGYAVDGFAANFTGAGSFQPSIKAFAIEKAIHDYLLSMVLANHFQKFPNLRIASVENGAEFIPDLFRKLRSQDRKLPGWFKEDPVEVFRRHVWINPFWEDDLGAVVEWMGAERVIFGSDWPHIEGLPQPLDYVRETKELTADDRARVLLTNATELATLQPT